MFPIPLRVPRAPSTRPGARLRHPRANACRQSLRSLVCPFTNMSGRSGSRKYFSDGITDEHHHRFLSPDFGASFVVRPPQRAFNPSSKTVEIDQARPASCRSLVLKGSGSGKRENRIRITAPAVDAATGWPSPGPKPAFDRVSSRNILPPCKRSPRPTSSDALHG